MQARGGAQQDPEQRGAETHEGCGTLGRQTEEGEGGGSLALTLGAGAAGREHCPLSEKTPWARVLPSPAQCAQCAPGLARWEDNPTPSSPAPADGGVDPGLASRAAASTSGPSLSHAPTSPLGPPRPQDAGAEHAGKLPQEPHPYNQVWWKLKAIRDRAGFISISSTPRRNGECADGKLNPARLRCRPSWCVRAQPWPWDSQAARSAQRVPRRPGPREGRKGRICPPAFKQSDGGKMTAQREGKGCRKGRV